MAVIAMLGAAAAGALLCGLGLPPNAVAQPIPAVVLSIGDGDTLRVRQGGQAITVRLACIDAPETAQSPYGQQARRFLQQRLAIGKPVTLEVKTTDRYGRAVAEVIAGGNINLALVEEGHDFVYRQFLQGCNAKAYLRAEEEARRQRLGVWQLPGGVIRPWDYRRGRRAGATSSLLPAQQPPRGIRIAATDHTNRYRCREIGSFARAQQLLRQGHSYLDRDGDGVACESLR